MIDTAKGQLGGRREGAGAPRGNQNRLRHGMRASSLPKQWKYIEWAGNKLRRQLEGAVGETTVGDAALISSAVRHERAASLAERWLRQAGDSLPLGERLSLLHSISRSTDSRDRCIRLLNLHGTADPWDTLNRPRLTVLDATPDTSCGAGDDASHASAESYDDHTITRHPVSNESDPSAPPAGQAAEDGTR